MPIYQSHGNGKFKLKDFKKIGKNVIIEPGAMIFHPENIEIGDNVYIGHQAIIKGYYKNKLIIGSGSWIGQQCFLHGAGGLKIGQNVGIDPGVKIITSHHQEGDIEKPIIASSPVFKKVIIGSGSDLGINSCILPGVTIGKGVQIGAGAVVTKNIPDYEVWVGVPARMMRKRFPSQHKEKYK